MKGFCLTFLLLLFASISSADFEERDDLVIGASNQFRFSTTSALPAFRVHSFGNTSFNLNLTTKSALAGLEVFVEGPFDKESSYGDETPVGKGPHLAGPYPISSAHEINTDVLLSEPGIYRVYFTLPQKKFFKKTDITLKTKCLSNCDRPSDSLSEFILKTPQEHRKTLIKEIIGHVKDSIHAPWLRDTITKQLQILTDKKLDEILTSKETQKRIDMLPSFPPLSQLGNLQLLLEGLPNQGALEFKPIVGDLNTLLRQAKTDRDAPLPTVLKGPPPISYGHFNSKTLPKKILDQSPLFSNVLNSLATEQASLTWTDFKGKTQTLQTIPQLIQALIQSGHTIRLSQEITDANFLSLTSNERYSRIPSWLDTGIDLSDGSRLKIPMGHSELRWEIRGPVVNANIGFFLGLKGIGFFPAIDERPRWTGLKSNFVVEGIEENLECLEESFNLANSLMLQNRLERDHISRNGLANNGYGVLGVCNDTTGLLLNRLGLALGSQGPCTDKMTNEKGGKIEGVHYPYPMVRLSSLPKMGNPLWTAVYPEVPQDTSHSVKALNEEPLRTHTLCRILGMVPHSLRSKEFPNAEFKRQIALVKREVGAKCETFQENHSPQKPENHKN